MATEIVYDERGFDDNGIHRDTRTEFDPEGFNINGFDDEGYDAEGYNEDGWDRDGIHVDTGTEFGPNGRCEDGSRYNSDGYDSRGYDREGYDEEGYDEDGYNEDGLDSNGDSRCDNGDCYDTDCRCHTESDESNSDELLDSCACVLSSTDWQRYKYKPTAPTVAFEFECISTSTANAAQRFLLEQWNGAYKSIVNASHTGKGAICKHDGSLPDGTGVEFVTVPMLLEQHRLVLRAAFTHKFGDGRVNAWSQSKCGMHVHVARSSLSNLTLGKMLCFMHQPSNVAFHIAIAGRQSTYAQFLRHRSEVSNGLPEKACRGEKYSALNVKPHTVEFRIFRPSCRFDTLIKNLCYCLAVREFCRQSSLSDSALHWEHFLIWLGTTQARLTYRELDAWLRASESSFGEFYRRNAMPLPKPKPTAA